MSELGYLHFCIIAFILLIFNQKRYTWRMVIRIIKTPIPRSELQRIANERFGDLVKGAVDVRQKIIALGPELHADAESELIEKEGSLREDVWGINLYPAEHGDGFIEFDSLINLKPALGNRTRGVDNAKTREEIAKIVNEFIAP